MVPKSGSRLPARPISDAELAAALGEALTGELGGSRRAVKTIMAWARVSDRTARSWLQGNGCPGGRHLLLLATHCDAVMLMLLSLSGRDAVRLSLDLGRVEGDVARLLDDIRETRGKC